ncbi:MAG: hypothetical protein GF313_09135 [Caldithrix sp.]|nr:hypothetical protein [Caldithrix sp.]
MERFIQCTVQKMLVLMLPFLLIWTIGTNAQQVKELSLEEAKQYALENNRDVRKAAMDIEVASKEKWAVTASGFPQVEASAEVSKLLDIPTQLIPGEFFGRPGETIPVQFGKPFNANYGISASQLIFSGSYFVGVRAAGIYMKLSKENLERTELETKATVTKTYILSLIAEENQKVLSKTLKNVQQTRYEVEEMYKEGFTEQTDVKQLQISVNELENNIRALQKQIDLTHQLLKIQMGMPVDQSIQLTDRLEAILTRVNIGPLLEQTFTPQDNINFRAVVTREELADMQVRRQYTRFLPTLAAFGSIQRDAQRDKFNLLDSDKKWFPTTVIGIRLSWPIFSGGSKMFDLQKARVERKKARLDKIEAREGLSLQYKQARTKVIEARDRQETARANRDLAKEVYEINQEKFKEGMISSLDLTQSHNQYLDAEAAYLQAVSDMLTAQTELKKILEIL